ncbi:MAG: hypothetical protein JRL30_14185 [Deltaproteobacteria bacterium]|nr:hypothetical protein [Deltaproteobacteria bacterium]
MKTTSAIIFPHTYLPESNIKRIASSFGTITIFVPWYMEPVTGLASHTASLNILRPAEHTRPPEDFKRLLSEYRLWMQQNQRHAAPVSTETGEDTTWEIRQSIRKTGKAGIAPADDHAFKWHLILHLERELEENLASADEILLRMKAKKSPLEEALEETNPSQDLFEDLPLSGVYPSTGEHHLGQILTAWFGLFGGMVQDDSILLTLDARVMAYAMGLFEAEPNKPYEKEGAPFLKTVYLPRLSDDSDLLEDPVSAGLSGKTLILLEYG